jgi:hypothetical protein
MHTPIIFAADAKYPNDLMASEAAEIAARRRINQIDPGVPRVGVALSGGGIRSATFCLGFFQALARRKLVRRIDYLSTVSGGGYFGSFLGAAFSRDDATPEKVESELANNHSWSVNWLRENGRFLSPNGAGDNWQAAAVALRNWATLHVVLLTFGFLILGFAALIRADLSNWTPTASKWISLERFFWQSRIGDFWPSPWFVLPAVSFALLMIPSGTVYWLTQATPLMAVLRRARGLFQKRYRDMTVSEFIARSQGFLSRSFMVGLMTTIVLFLFALVDSFGQSAYLIWSRDFSFPALWALLTSGGALLFGFGSKIAVYLERLPGRFRFSIPLSAVALVLALAWLLLIVFALSVVSCGFGWEWLNASSEEKFHPMTGVWNLFLIVTVALAASWIFSRSFAFVNLSSMQQIYTARLSRAYLGASNPHRRRHKNFDMTDLMPGDDITLDDYAPQRRGGPLHFINVTVNETVSGKTQIERRDRKGLAMAVGPCGLSVGHDSHALWATEPAGATPRPRRQALWDSHRRAITPVDCGTKRFHALCENLSDSTAASPQRVEALALGRWVAISGAAFTTGTGATTSFGLSFLLGLANVRLGYWWDSGINPESRVTTAPNFLEIASRLLSRLLPVQTCLMNECFARFHGPNRRHWYLSDGGHFENTACYELIRRRVPFIICVDAGQDADYQFADFANLVRKARTDFRAEIQIVRRAADAATDDPGVLFPMPKLEDIVHPSLLDVIGTPEDFTPLDIDPATPSAESRARCSRRHALLARIHYTDTDDFCWLLLVKPSLMGDETADVIQYQRTHPLFPQEPTTDQYFDEAQWESYRKLGEHIGTELFTPPTVTNKADRATWTPSQMTPPKTTAAPPPASFAMAS